MYLVGIYTQGSRKLKLYLLNVHLVYCWVPARTSAACDTIPVEDNEHEKEKRSAGPPPKAHREREKGMLQPDTYKKLDCHSATSEFLRESSGGLAR